VGVKEFFVSFCTIITVLLNAVVVKSKGGVYEGRKLFIA